MYRPPWWIGDVPYFIPKGFDIGLYSSSVSSNAKNMVVASLYDLHMRDKNLVKGELFNKQYIISSNVRD